MKRGNQPPTLPTLITLSLITDGFMGFLCVLTGGAPCKGRGALMVMSKSANRVSIFPIISHRIHVWYISYISICLHLVDIYGNVGDITIHGSYGLYGRSKGSQQGWGLVRTNQQKKVRYVQFVGGDETKKNEHFTNLRPSHLQNGITY